MVHFLIYEFLVQNASHWMYFFMGDIDITASRTVQCLDGSIGGAVASHRQGWGFESHLCSLCVAHSVQRCAFRLTSVPELLIQCVCVCSTGDRCPQP